MAKYKDSLIILEDNNEISILTIYSAIAWVLKKGINIQILENMIDT